MAKKRELAELVEKLKEDKKKIEAVPSLSSPLIHPLISEKLLSEPVGWNPFEEILGWLPRQMQKEIGAGLEAISVPIELFKENVAEPFGATLLQELGIGAEKTGYEKFMPPMFSPVLPRTPEMEQYGEKVPWLAREAAELPAWLALELPVRGVAKGAELLRGAKVPKVKPPVRPTTPTKAVTTPEGLRVRAGAEGAGMEAIPPEFRAVEEAAMAARAEIATAEFDRASSDALIKSIRGAKKQRVSAMERQHVERQRRTAISAEVAKREVAAGRPEEALRLGARATGGELPKTQFYESPGKVLSAEQIASLRSQITKKWMADPKDEFRFWTGVQTDEALTRVIGNEALGIVGGEIPTFRQLGLLMDMFGPEIVSSIMAKRSNWAKLLDNSMSVLHVPKAVQSSYDLSNAFRQSWFFTMNPMNYKQTMSAMNAQIMALKSEKVALRFNQQIIDHPLYELARKSTVDLIEVRMGVADLRARADPFMSRLAEHIPGVSHSQRAFITFSNKMRHEMFYKYAQRMLDKGMTWETDGAAFQRLGEFMNIATGRGLLGKLESLGPELGLFFWSPRLVAARVELVPYLLFKSPPIVRKQLIMELVASTSSTIGILTAMKMSGVADVGLDPRSADFGKIRIGNTRIDMWGGFQQYAVFLTRMYGSLPGIPPEKGGKSSTSGNFYDIDPIEAAARFLRYKTSPAPSFFIDLWLEENAIGEPMADKKAADHAWERLSPFVMRDIVEAYQEEGTSGILLGLPGIIGHGVTSYGEREKWRGPPWPKP